MLDVRVCSIIQPEKYKELIEKYNDIFHTEKQVIYFLDLNGNFEFIKTKTYSKICFNTSNIHENIQDKKIVQIDKEYTSNMSDILETLKYFPKVKWYRTRNVAKLEFGIEMHLDYIIGYGYILKVKKQVDDSSKLDISKIELGNFLESLNVDITQKKELDEKFDEYILNWDIYTKDVKEDIFLR